MSSAVTSLLSAKRRRKAARRAVVGAKRFALRQTRDAIVRYVAAEPRPEDRVGAERRLTILLSSAWGMGGTIRAALNLAEYLAARDYEVQIVTTYRRRDTPFFGEFAPGVQVVALDDQRPGAEPRGLARHVRRALKRRRSVLYHPSDRLSAEFSLWSDIRLARLLRRRTGFLMSTRAGYNLLAAELSPPGMVTIGLEQVHLHQHGPEIRKAMPGPYRSMDAFVVLTEQDMAEYEKLLGTRANLHRIPNTVREMGGEKADMSIRTVLAAGRLRRQKGFDLLVPAFAQVAAEFPDWRLRLCGSGLLHKQLAAQIAESGAAEQISLEPAAERLGDEMAKASIFALSSRFEGFPLILLEAMSKGMAAVAFDCPTGPGDIIDDHRNGILVPAKDVDAFAAGLRALMADEELRRRCATAAVGTAHQYTMGVIGPEWERLFAELWARRSDAPGLAGAPAAAQDDAPEASTVEAAAAVSGA
jgi:glycosyltransferase involved in cell wall biosynthesis